MVSIVGNAKPNAFAQILLEREIPFLNDGIFEMNLAAKSKNWLPGWAMLEGNE